MNAKPGPPSTVSRTPRPQPIPLRSLMPLRMTNGSSTSPAQRKRCAARSAGQKPTSRPWRAPAKPAAQNTEAPMPQAMPTAAAFDRLCWNTPRAARLLLACLQLDQLADLLLAQQRRDELQRHRFGEQRVEALDLVGIDQSLW